MVSIRINHTRSSYCTVRVSTRTFQNHMHKKGSFSLLSHILRSKTFKIILKVYFYQKKYAYCVFSFFLASCKGRRFSLRASQSISLKVVLLLLLVVSVVILCKNVLKLVNKYF